MLSNIPISISNKLNAKLHLQNDHPIKLIKDIIYDYFTTNNYKFEHFDNEPNIVSTIDNFDLLLIPKDHPSRSKSDTYYVTNDIVLRTHTSAHQNKLLALGKKSFLVTGDVYRKDEIDRFHYPVFHQMECVNICETDCEVDLKKTLSGLVEYLFPNKEYRFNEDYFPFTHPSFEIEVKLNDKWVEILGGGVIHRDILDHHGIKENGWAFGLGLERLAMILFSIPDIRLFWSTDVKFLNQFMNQIILKDDFRKLEFKPYSNLDSLPRDISFFINEKDIIINNDLSFDWMSVNDFYEIIREICGDNIESVNLYDKFFNKKINKYSHTFRLLFSPNSDVINPAEFIKSSNECVEQLRKIIENKLSIELR